VRTTIDGRIVGEGSPDSLSGGPLASLVFLLNNLAQRGRSLRKGDLVSTGAVTGVHPAPAGSQSRVEIPGAAVIEVLAERDTGLA
jgi:2-keto-4-pentenoate hydratase